MGQRAQIFVRVPKSYWNEGNPNNKPPRVFVLHNQWLYNELFVVWTAKFLRALKYKIDEAVNSPFKFKLEQVIWEGDRSLIDEAMNHANYSDLGLMTYTHHYNDAGADENKELGKGVDAFIDVWDNNDGYLFVEVTEKGELQWDILTGDKKRVDATGYLESYDDSERDAQTLDALQQIAEFKRTNVYVRLEDLRRQVFAQKV